MAPTTDFVRCRICKKTEPATTTSLTFDRCGDCQFWHSFAILADDPNSVRIEGRQFFLGSETDRDKGFDGRPFYIRFHTGKRITTTNLNSCGKIPKRWRTKLPDNARFYKRRKPSSNKEANPSQK